MSRRHLRLNAPRQGRNNQASYPLETRHPGPAGAKRPLVALRYGRTVGRVYVGGVDVNAEMVRQGAAWVYRQYAKDQSLYRLEEQAKKAARRGLWGLPEAERCPPWDWRKNACPTSTETPAPDSPAASTPKPATSGGFTCAGKRYCREMTSCEEAKFYLNTRGVRSLDGNRDGVPCEALCR